MPNLLTEQALEALFVTSLSRTLSPLEERMLKPWLELNANKAQELRAVWLALGAFKDTREVKAMRKEALDHVGSNKARTIIFDLERLFGVFASRRAALLGFGLVFLLGLFGLFSLNMPKTQTYDSPAQAIGHFQLDDGTKVTLSAGGKLESRMDKKNRTLKLLAGDGYFTVAHDKTRPLKVLSGAYTVVDLGTEFNISHSSDRYHVTLVSGKASIHNAKSGFFADLKPGQTYRDVAGIEKISTDDEPNLIGWASGILSFDDVSLAEVNATYARLSGRKLVFSAPELSALRLSGVLHIERLDATCQALSATLPIKATPTKDGNILISNL